MVSDSKVSFQVTDADNVTSNVAQFIVVSGGAFTSDIHPMVIADRSVLPATSACGVKFYPTSGLGVRQTDSEPTLEIQPPYVRAFRACVLQDSPFGYSANSNLMRVMTPSLRTGSPVVLRLMSSGMF
jgi:hypothetical protein